MNAESRYRDLFESTPATLYVSTADGTLLDANPALVELLGFPDRATLLGANVRELYVDPEARARWVDRVVSEGVVHGFEAELRRYDGTIIWVRDTARLREGDDGEPVFEGTVEEITQQKRAEAALRESRQTLANLLASLPGIAYRCARQLGGPLELISDGCRAVTGHPPEAFLDGGELVYADLIEPSDREAAEEAIERAVAARRPYRVEYRITDADGQMRLVSDQGRGVWSDDGAFLHREGFVADVSERWAAEQALRDSEAWYRTLFESANDAIFLMDRDRFIDCNSRTLEIFGHSAEQIVGARPYELSPPRQPDGRQSAEAAAERIRAALRGEPQFFEWRHLRANGELFDTEVNLSRVDIAGRTFLQAIVREISDRKRAEEALGRRDQILEGVGFAAAAFLQGPAWQSLADEVLAHLGEAAEASRLILYELVADGAGPRLVRLHGWVAPDAPPQAQADPLDGREATTPGVARWLEEASVGRIVTAPLRDLPEAEQALLEEAGVESTVVAPVVVGGELWGLMEVDDCSRERVVSSGELEAIRAAADILGGAVYLDRARRAVEARTEELEILSRVNALLASTLDAEAVMQEVTDIVCSRLGVEHVSVALVDRDASRLHFVAWSGYDAPVRNTGLELDGPGLVAAVARAGEALYARDVGEHPDYLCADPRVRSEHVAPMLANDEVLGVLNCESFRGNGIGGWQRSVIDRLAAQAAIALRNAEIVRRLGG